MNGPELHDRLPEHLHARLLQWRGTELPSQGFLDSQYPEGAVRFYEMLARWREKGEFEGLVIE